MTLCSRGEPGIDTRTSYCSVLCSRCGLFLTFLTVVTTHTHDHHPMQQREQLLLPLKRPAHQRQDQMAGAR